MTITKRQVTERDIRIPEFQDAKLEDLEFRDDGKVVRKDRWETGIRRIVSLVSQSEKSDLIPRDWEIGDVVDAVDQLLKYEFGWESFNNFIKFSENYDLFNKGENLSKSTYSIRLRDNTLFSNNVRLKLVSKVHPLKIELDDLMLVVSNGDQSIEINPESVMMIKLSDL